MSIIKNTEELNNLLDAVQKLPVKKDEQEKVIDITENGTTVVTPDEGMTLGGVTVNVEVESGGGEDFVGIKLSGFSGNYGLPTVADARSVPTVTTNNKYTYYWFANSGRNESDGYWALLESAYLSNGLLSFGQGMFIYCTNLKNIYGDFTELKKIDANCFRACVSLASVPYMPQLVTLGDNAFLGCTSLTEFKFYTKPDSTNKIVVSVAASAFKDCTNLLNIYVPWAEGEVDNAPWGATNATIHYNTTFDENGNPIDCSCDPETEGCPDAES